MQSASGQAVGGRVRRLRRFALWAVSGGVAVLVCFHQPLLTYVAQRLIVEQRRSHFDRVVVYGGEGRFDEAAAEIQGGTAAGVLLLEEEPIRPVRLGILPSSITSARQALTARGISDAVITDVLGPQHTRREAARQLGDWLRERPDLHVQFLCRQLESAGWRDVLDSELEASVAQRIFVQGLPDRSYEESRWWRSRSGVRAVCLEYIGRLYEILGEGERVRREPWNPDAFAEALRAGKPS